MMVSLHHTKTHQPECLKVLMNESLRAAGTLTVMVLLLIGICAAVLLLEG